MSSQLPIGPSIPSILGKRGRVSTSLRLPTSPSAAFSEFNNPFTRKSKRERGIQNESIEMPTIRDIGINSFRTTDFRESRGDFAKAAFNVKVKKTFGPQNLPRNRRRKNFIGLEF